ncbi:hypothetical protein GCM10009504_47460 [Pseudomonas laurentiana]|nr:hypothetical protein GCM10009504_47460 [Pseudomonas laurentiana]
MINYFFMIIIGIIFFFFNKRIRIIFMVIIRVDEISNLICECIE